ncbi:hypothetical protein BDV32DRAFT_88856 [Aspergillus pseudonomiae]|nr:hypothetical protein BDV32DRAFT_88856 [Aspergillus pseudonomiae]
MSGKHTQIPPKGLIVQLPETLVSHIDSDLCIPKHSLTPDSFKMKVSVAVLSLFLAASMAMPAPVCFLFFFSFELAGSWVARLGTWLNVDMLMGYRRSRTRSSPDSSLTILMTWRVRRVSPVWSRHCRRVSILVAPSRTRREVPRRAVTREMGSHIYN